MATRPSTTPEPVGILPALQDVQAAHGYVPDAAIAQVADRLNVSRADVYGVLTYYSDLRTTPPPEVVVRVCLGEACQSVGARDLLVAVAGSPTCEVSRVFCLGNCALGPTAEVNGRLLGRATAETVQSWVEAATT